MPLISNISSIIFQSLLFNLLINVHREHPCIEMGMSWIYIQIAEDIDLCLPKAVASILLLLPWSIYCRLIILFRLKRKWLLTYPPLGTCIFVNTSPTTAASGYWLSWQKHGFCPMFPPCNFRKTCRVRGPVPDHQKKFMYGRELNSQITSQRQRVRAQEQNKMKAEYLVAGSKNWQPFCQEKCVQNLVKFADFMRTRVGQSAGLQVGGVMGCFCVVAAELSTRTSKFWMTIPGPSRLRAAMHGHSWSKLGRVETWPFRRHHFHPIYSISRLQSCDDSILLFFLSTKLHCFSVLRWNINQS